MIKTFTVGLVTALAFTGVANAHTHLEKATPADGSTVASAPTEYVLTFEEAARLTALTIQNDGGAEQKIAALPKAAAAVLKVPAAHLENGHYVLRWRVVGDDGHVMTGKIGFTVGGKPSPGAEPHVGHTEH